MCNLLSLPECFIILSFSLLAVSPKYVSEHVFSGHLTKYVRSCLCTSFVWSFMSNAEPSVLLIYTCCAYDFVVKDRAIRLKKKIARIIMDAELQNKHTEKRKLKKKFLEVTGKLRRKVTVIIYSTILHQINKAIKSKEKAISTRHTKKMNKLR